MKESRFDAYGGVYAPETLMAPLEELESAWRSAWQDTNFRERLDTLLRDYAGRPTALTPAERLSAEFGFELWLKREDLLHTGAHKLNNALGQCLLAKQMGKTRIWPRPVPVSMGSPPRPLVLASVWIVWSTWGRSTPRVSARMYSGWS